jgi:DNA modification methylase
MIESDRRADSGHHAAIKRRLEEFDWDFATQQSESPFSRLHWHPCRFPSQVPATAISRLSRVGQTVLDPFMGSATTLVEAQRLGRKPVGIDINPVSVLMASSKVLTASAAEVTKYVDYLSTEVIRRWSGLEPAELPKGVQGEKWFAPKTLLELRKLWSIVDVTESGLPVLGRAAFSSILLGVCKETRHWGYVCDNSTPKTERQGEAKLAFLKALSQVKAAYLHRDQFGSGQFQESRVLRGDARTTLAEFEQESIDLVVTSPPYFGVADYAKAQRLSMEWFDFEIEPVRLREIGARSKRHRSTAGRDFVAELTEVFSETYRVLRAGAYGVVVFGSSPSRKDVFSEFLNGLTEVGFLIVSEIPRSISTMRRQSPSLSTEHVVVFMKE